MQHKIDRRAFLKLAGCAGVASALPLVSPALGLASLGRDLKVAQEARMLMGTVVAVTVVDPSAAKAQAALEAAFTRMTALTPIFDRHRAGGPVAQLNAEGRLNHLTPELTGVLGLAQRVHQDTGGAFDITVAPVLDAYRASFAQNGRPPAASVLQHAMAAIGGLRVDGSGLAFTADGAGVTLDGLAKGWIADQGIAALRAAGVSRALINAGGDIAALGQRGEGQPWRVAVSDPHDPLKAKVIVKLDGGAIATSGSYEVFFDHEQLYHHIIDPQAGRSPRTDVSVSVRAPQAALADALSTACFVMHPPQAMAYLKSRGLTGMILTRQGQRLQSEGFTAA